jgi:hypothetical protein
MSSAGDRSLQHTACMAVRSMARLLCLEANQDVPALVSRLII